MGRRENDLYIGNEFLNIEGRAIKHPALIKHFATINVNKISDNPIDLIGLDLETNHLTGELKLLGFYDLEYEYFTENFIEVLFGYIKYAKRKNKSLAYWNKLDSFVLYKQFLYHLNDKEIKLSLDKYGAISGEWSKKDKKWLVNPVVEIDYKDYKFGINNVIRSNIQFFYYNKYDKKIKMLWAFDIAQLYEAGLEKEATSRLNYYSKVDKSAHLVNWERFIKDTDYRENIVLKSNMLDSKAVKDLGLIIQEEFKKAFNYYPKSLVSQGSLARASIVAKIRDMYLEKYNEEEAQEHIINDIKAIGFVNFYDEWEKTYGDYFMRDLFCITTESYSGGYIEAIRYGKVEEAYYSDIASAYPSIIIELYDLRESKLTRGVGEPPHIKNSYCFVRGEITLDESINFHPVTIKHPFFKETNIRATGNYIASYTIDERDYLKSIGATFKNEEWFNIETKGVLSPLSKVAKEFIELRKKFLKEKNSSQYMAKIAVNSMYGILFEAVDTYIQNGDEVIRNGYRAGEFFNPIFASYITARTRIKLAKASQSIENNGGKVLLLMTDSIFWVGESNMLPEDMYREEKTLGYFEAPKKVKNFISLGSGRYGYETDKGYVESKKRGLNAVDLHDKNGIPLDSFNWNIALNNVVNDKMNIKVRALVSVGMVSHVKKYTFHDLGRVVEEFREVELIVGKDKRFYKGKDLKVSNLLNGLVDTTSIYLNNTFTGKVEVVNQTLPVLRDKMMKITKEVKVYKNDKEVLKKASKKYYNNNKSGLLNKYNNNYKALREAGFTSYEAKKYASYSIDKIKTKLEEKLKC